MPSSRSLALLLVSMYSASAAAPYVLASTGNCASPITTAIQCEQAAAYFNFNDPNADIAPPGAPPSGCSWADPNLLFNSQPFSQQQDPCTQGQPCICLQPTATATTTTAPAPTTWNPIVDGQTSGYCGPSSTYPECYAVAAFYTPSAQELAAPFSYAQCRDTCHAHGDDYFEFGKPGTAFDYTTVYGNLCRCALTLTGTAGITSSNMGMVWYATSTASVIGFRAAPPASTTTTTTAAPTTTTTAAPTAAPTAAAVLQSNKWCNGVKTFVPGMVSKAYGGREQCLTHCRGNTACKWVGYRVADQYCEFWTSGSCNPAHDQPGHDIYQM